MQDPQTWFNSWERLGLVALAAIATYLTIIVVVRISGKRTTANLNSFDWLITVTIGSLASSGILLSDVAVTDALAAIIVLALCQFVLTWTVRKSDRFAAMVKAEPLLLLHRGHIIERNLSRARISVAELRACLRREGIADPAQAAWVVLETNGQMTVIEAPMDGRPADHWATSDVKSRDAVLEGPT
ncbi:hypothetical protein B2G71_13835 [Novosphingobium sp. PC22D]|uniref:DUF421 domain-containing protein n=1 Tax=Novosphingobium sp. PC22D TaxID=1962403 RepID=UPI000BF1D28D|nr:YetF domain-containing protein [Novosphingobium sp. PC22D]PEQ12207.1 hypothetical protein B2G71_13835 [Novosphingobium sp. PC22D]